MPPSLRTINTDAFRNSGLESLVVPEGVTYINQFAFRDATYLRNIELPSTVKYIGPMAFENCVSLESVTIPTSVKRLGALAFSGCINLRSVYFEGDAPDITITFHVMSILGLEEDVYSRIGLYMGPFCENTLATVYFRPGTNGWSPPYWHGVPLLER